MAINTTDIRFYVTPGHGYLRVPNQIADSVEARISAYSFKGSEFSYFEEDCDAYAFCAAAGINPDDIPAVTVSASTEARIQNLPRFS